MGGNISSNLPSFLNWLATIPLSSIFSWSFYIEAYVVSQSTLLLVRSLCGKLFIRCGVLMLQTSYRYCVNGLQLLHSLHVLELL